MPSHGLKTLSSTANRLATGTRFGPVSGLTGDKICLLSVSWKGRRWTDSVQYCRLIPSQSSRPAVPRNPGALGDRHDVPSPLTLGARAGGIGCALRGPTHSGESTRGSAAPTLGTSSTIHGSI